MSPFTALYILVFLIQFYIYFKIKRNFKIRLWQKIIFFTMVLITFSKLRYIRNFISEHFVEFHLYTQTIYYIYITFCLLFILFLILNSSLAFLFKKIELVKANILSEKIIVSFTITLSILFLALGFYNANYNVKIKHYTIESKLLEKNINQLRILHLTDIHLDSLTGPRALKHIVKLIEKEKPDLILVTGDLVDTDVTKRQKDAAILKSMKSTYGNFAVLGNHEIYAGYEMSVKFHKNAGLRLLEGESIEVAGLVISGISDPAVARIKPIITELELLTQEQKQYEDKFILLLKHRPQIVKETFHLFDLALTGHTHHGQIWPIHYIVKYEFPQYVRGLSKLEETNTISKHVSYLYNSAGAGFWGPPIRFLAPAEITVIDIINTSN